MEKSEQLNELIGALNKVQGALGPVLKDKENPFYNKTYADLASGWEACRHPLTENGLALTQHPTTENEGKVITLETVLLHASGQWMSSRLTMGIEKPTPQTIGSAITYARRYAMFAILGLAPVDDDANAAEGKAGKKGEKPAVKPSTVKQGPTGTAGGCVECGATVSDDVKQFSTKKYGKVLCMTHQAKAQPK